MFSKKVMLIAGSSAALVVAAGLGALTFMGNESAKNFCSKNSRLFWDKFDPSQVVAVYKDPSIDMLSLGFERRVSGPLSELKESLTLLSGAFVTSSGELRTTSESLIKNSATYLEELKKYETKVSTSEARLTFINQQAEAQKMIKDSFVYQAAAKALRDTKWQVLGDASLRDGLELRRVSQNNFDEWRDSLPETAELMQLEKGSISGINKIREICQPIQAGK